MGGRLSAASGRSFQIFGYLEISVATIITNARRPIRGERPEHVLEVKHLIDFKATQQPLRRHAVQTLSNARSET